MKERRKDGLSAIGIGAVACVACCTAPIVAFLGGLSVAGLLSTVLIGAAGAVIVGLALAGRVVLRRRTACVLPGDVSVPIAAPTRRPGDLERSATMTAQPIYDATVPIVCTAGSDEVPTRIEQLERMRAALVRLERTEHGLVLRFPNDAAVEDDVRQFAVDEKGCCQFWGFEIDTRPDQITLRWDGPPDTADFLDQLHGYFVGDEPITALSGLL